MAIMQVTCCIYAGFEVVVFVTAMLPGGSFCCNFKQVTVSVAIQLGMQLVRRFWSTYAGDSFCSKGGVDNFWCISRW